MAKLFGPKEVSQDEQARREARRAQMAMESKCIALIIDGAAHEDAVAQCPGITVEMVNEWTRERRIPRQSDLAKPYRATDQDLH